MRILAILDLVNWNNESVTQGEFIATNNNEI